MEVGCCEVSKIPLPCSSTGGNGRGLFRFSDERLLDIDAGNPFGVVGFCFDTLEISWRVSSSSASAS